jgi:thioredoxin-related protein
MEKLPTPLRILINQYGFVTVPIVPLLILGIILGQNGWSFTDAAIMGAVLALIVVWWWTQHARQSANAPASTPSLLNEIGQSGKYAMLAFESEYCISSTTVGRRLSELESTHPDKFQIYELSIFKEPGKDLFKQYDGKVTPTYVLLNPEGQVMMEWPLVLPVERVTYALKQQEARK